MCLKPKSDILINKAICKKLCEDVRYGLKFNLCLCTFTLGLGNSCEKNIVKVVEQM